MEISRLRIGEISSPVLGGLLGFLSSGVGGFLKLGSELELFTLHK